MKNDLSNIKILVAEDNEVNKLLASRMLDQWNVTYKTAHTGNEVLALLQQEDFDIILMDIQMPEMSGIDATIAIRNLLNETKKSIPIIALTANALKGEEQKFLKAGMNDLLIKPFKANDLLQVLKRNLTSVKNTITTTKVALTENTTTSIKEKLYDLSLVNEIADNNQDFIKTLLQIYLDTIPATSKELLHELSLHNWEQAGKLAHKLKSTIDTMLIVSIKDDIRTIEHCGKTKERTHLMLPLAQKVDAIIHQVANDFKKDFGL